MNFMRSDPDPIFSRGSYPDPGQLHPDPKPPCCTLIPRLFLTLLYPILCTNLQPVVSMGFTRNLHFYKILENIINIIGKLC